MRMHTSIIVNPLPCSNISRTAIIGMKYAVKFQGGGIMRCSEILRKYTIDERFTAKSHGPIFSGCNKEVVVLLRCKSMELGHLEFELGV